MNAPLTPKYLTEDLAKLAVETALLTAFSEDNSISTLMKRRQCHVVVLVPAMHDARPENYPEWPDYPLFAFPIYQCSFDKEKWEKPYDSIARCKALQLWGDRNDDRTDIIPHLLFPGDVPFWGGVKRHEIVVACSGVQPYFDKMISGITADIIAALAYDAYVKDEDRNEGIYLT